MPYIGASPAAAPKTPDVVQASSAAADDEDGADDDEVTLSKDGDETAAVAATPTTPSPAPTPAPQAPVGMTPGAKEKEEEAALEAEVDKELEEEDEKARAEEEAAAKAETEAAKEADKSKAKGAADDLISDMDKTEKLQRDIADQTHSKALSEMLTRVRTDTYMIRQKLDVIEREISDGVAIEAPDPSESLIYPLSVCMQCILALTALYFFVYTALAMCKVFTDAFDLGQNTICEVALQGACDTVFYAPMLCVLFLGTQLRASQISQGQRGPPQVAELGMQACCWSVFLQTLLVLALPAFTGTVASVEEEGVALPPQESRAMAGLLTVIRYAAMAGLYIGFTVVCITVVLMDVRTLGLRPVDIWDDPTTARTEYAPEVSVAMKCTMGLTLLFFFVYLFHAIFLTMTQLTSGEPLLPDTMRETASAASAGATLARRLVVRCEARFKACTQAVSMAPMVCTLFMAARMRALEIDPKDGRPQYWAEYLFLICAATIFGQVIAILVFALMGVESQAADGGGQDLDELACAEASGTQRLLIAIRSFLLFVAYVAIVGVLVALTELQHTSHYSREHEAPPFSPAMECVLILSAVYFFVYFCLFIAQAVARLSFSLSSSISQERAEALLRMVYLWKLAEYTVKLCPMTALFALGARERALDMSAYGGSPQCWAQDAMYVATAALLLQLLLVLLGGALSRGVGVDEAGSPITRGMKYRPGRAALDVLRALAFVALYGGVAVVGVSVLVIRPETAGCIARGFHPMVPG